MSGYIHDPLQIINLISDNLRDRYKDGFSVIKEIIQNADDSGSSGDKPISLDIGLSPGITGAKHTLFKGPAVFFLNNGDFKDSDDRAIRSFGLNSKAIDSATIGKFGLGMKSVFHFCEAFFYMAKGKGNGIEYARILNPWSGPPEYQTIHGDWDDFEDTDKILLKKHIEKLPEDYFSHNDTWFLLWLPLRRREHVHGDSHEAGTIVSEFPGEDLSHLSFLKSPEITIRLSKILPLLRRIYRIRYWDFDTQSGNYSSVYHIEMKSSMARIKFDSFESSETSFYGKILNTSTFIDPAESLFVYTGIEKHINSQTLEQLRDSECWPKSYVRKENGQSIEAKDKAQGHCAVVFSRYETPEEPVMDIKWAVFMPIDTGKELVSINNGSSFSYSLTLHGYFFVDAGRTKIGEIEPIEEGQNFEYPANETQLRQTWNQYLAQEGTLRQIIPALSEFINNHGLNYDDINGICQSFKKSKTFRQYANSICNSEYFISKITKQSVNWTRCPVCNLLPLPTPPKDNPQRPWSTFPQLSFLEEDHCFVEDGNPHLVPEAHNSSWNAFKLEKILDINVSEVFQEKKLLNYFHSFLAIDSVKKILIEDRSIQQRLICIFRKALRLLGRSLTGNKSKMQDILSLINKKDRFTLSGSWSAVTDSMLKADTRTLIIPNELSSKDDTGSTSLTVDDAIELFKEIDKFVRDREDDGLYVKHDECNLLCKQIINAVDKNILRQSFGKITSLKIFYGYDCQQGSKALLSLEQILKCRDRGLLFLFSQGINENQRLGLSLTLQNAIDEHVILINTDTASLLFENTREFKPCINSSCLSTLGQKPIPIKDDLNVRAELIAKCSSFDTNDELQIQGMRYILHGKIDYFYDDKPLWLRSYQQDHVWEKMWRLLPDNNVDDWRLINRDLVEHIPQQRWTALSLREIRPKEILNRFDELEFKNLQGSQLSYGERESILSESIDLGDIWKRIPLHETLGGHFCAIPDENAFLESDIQLPVECLDDVLVFRISGNSKIKGCQKKYLNKLTHRDKVEILLKISEPSKFYLEIMDSLSQINPIDELDSELKHSLKTRAWLLDSQSKPVCPGDVIYLESLRDELIKLTEEMPDVYYVPEKLRNELFSHSAFDEIKRNLFAREDDGLGKLGLLLGEIDSYAVGEIATNDLDELEVLIDVMKQIPPNIDSPAWEILGKIKDFYGVKKCERLISNIKRPIPLKKVVNLLNWISSRDTSCGTSEKEKNKITYNKYLEVFAKIEGSGASLKQIKLLNTEGFWKESGSLCADAEGIAPSNVIDREQRRILSSIIITGGQLERASEEARHKFDKDVKLRAEETTGILRRYFEPWEDLVSPETIRAFLSILGDSKSLLELAHSYQGGHSVEWMRDELPWVTNKQMESDGQKCWLYGMDQHEAMSVHRFIVLPVKGESVPVISITGEKINAVLDKQFETLIVGDIWYEKAQDNLIFPKIFLRSLNTDNFTEESLSNLLRKSMEYLLKKAYNQYKVHLDDLWTKIDKTEQLDVRTTQQLVMKHLPYYLKQLGNTRQPELKKVISHWNDARYKVAEYSEKPEKKRNWEAKEIQALEKIKQLLENNKDVQTAILESVRSKIKDYQYTEDRILFELFQNADDAVVELEEIRFNSNTELSQGHSNRFDIHYQEGSLIVMHWGRPINYIGGSSFSGRERGFHQDLEKMLILSSSDKSGEKNITGKFGLGFKSVFLISEQPTIISGRIKVDILGGVYPQKTSDIDELTSLLRKESVSNEKTQGTLLKLPVSKGNINKVLDSFEHNAALLPVFSRRIRKVNIFKNANQPKHYEWNYDVLLENDAHRIEIGKIHFADNNAPNSAMHFRIKNGGGLLIGYSSTGFKRLPIDIPAIWVVAPTKEIEGVGFAVNGTFEVDAGRTSLSKASQSNEIQKIGLHLGECFEAMFMGIESQGWDSFKEHLGLSTGLTPYEFWESFWNVLTEGWVDKRDSKFTGILQILFSNDISLDRLVKRKKALPSGLWTSKYQVLTSSNQIRFVVRGSLSREDVFNQVSQLRIFTEKASPGSIISSKVHDSLCKISPNYAKKRDQWQSLTLDQVIIWMRSDGYKVSPEAAKILGQIITCDFIDKLSESEEIKNEKKQVRNALKELKFLTKSGTWANCKDNILADSIENDHADEGLRSAFAPADNVLSHQYCAVGINFFIACREKMEAPAELLLKWVLDAKTVAARSAALRYLLDGEMGERVAMLLRKKMGGTWLEDLTPEDEIFHEWPQSEIQEVLIRKLKPIEEFSPFFDIIPSNITPSNVETVFDAIREWWDDEVTRTNFIDEYEKQAWPDWLRNEGIKQGLENESKDHWMALLILGACRSIGRTRRSQHRSFLEFINNKGWWETFNDHVTSEDWMNVLEDWQDSSSMHIDKLQWMSLFPSIYQFSRYHHVYRRLLQASSRRPEDYFYIQSLLSPRVDESYSFAGKNFDAPPAPVNFGLHWILRELYRMEIINGNHIAPYCWVPSSRLIDFIHDKFGMIITDNGMSNPDKAKSIHEFIFSQTGPDNNYFHRTFDIPFLHIIKNPGLQSRFGLEDNI